MMIQQEQIMAAVRQLEGGRDMAHPGFGYRLLPTVQRVRDGKLVEIHFQHWKKAGVTAGEVCMMRP